MENIRVKQLVGKSLRRLRMRLYDVAFHELKDIIRYQMEKYGKKLTLVNPAYTSMTCAKCGHVKKDLTLADRVFVCPKCGWVADRDYNASLNILRAGSGLPLESVDREPLLYIPFSKGVYSKFRGRSRKSSPRGGDAPSVRAG